MTKSMNVDITSLINSTAEADSKNQLTIEQIRDWLSRFLASYDEEMAQFPELSEMPFVDVIAADFDFGRPAFFVAAMLVRGKITLAAGLAGAHALRTFLEQEFPENAGQIISELGNNFKLTDKQLIIDRKVLENWLKD